MAHAGDGAHSFFPKRPDDPRARAGAGAGPPGACSDGPDPRPLPSGRLGVWRSGLSSRSDRNLAGGRDRARPLPDRKSTRLNSSHVKISYAVFCLKKKKMELEADIK